MSPRILGKYPPNQYPNIIYSDGMETSIYDNDSDIRVSQINIIFHRISSTLPITSYGGHYNINHPIPQDLTNNTYHSRKVRLSGTIQMAPHDVMPEFITFIEDNPWLYNFKRMYDYILETHSWYIFSYDIINQLSFINNLNCLPILNINPICQLNPNVK